MYKTIKLAMRWRLLDANEIILDFVVRKQLTEQLKNLNIIYRK